MLSSYFFLKAHQKHPGYPSVIRHWIFHYFCWCGFLELLSAEQYYTRTSTKPYFSSSNFWKRIQAYYRSVTFLIIRPKILAIDGGKSRNHYTFFAALNFHREKINKAANFFPVITKPKNHKNVWNSELSFKFAILECLPIALNYHACIFFDVFFYMQAVEGKVNQSNNSQLYS